MKKFTSSNRLRSQTRKEFLEIPIIYLLALRVTERVGVLRGVKARMVDIHLLILDSSIYFYNKFLQNYHKSNLSFNQTLFTLFNY